VTELPADLARRIPVDTEPAGRSRRKLAIIGGLVIVVLLAAALVGAIIVHNRNEDAPLMAVRGYVDAIARGDASAANAAVPAAGADPALLTDQVLGSAKTRISVEDVTLAHSGDVAADMVNVEVTYRLGTSRTMVVLRAQRSGTTAGVLDNWTVIDPLVVPVRIETNEPTLTTAPLGAATVPTGGPGSDGFPERRFLVYPAIYELRGDESQYLTADPKLVVAYNLDYGKQPAITGQPVKTTVVYKATPQLTSKVASQLADHLTACFAAAVNVPKGCPIDAYGRRGTGGYRLLTQPDVKSIMGYQVEYKVDGSTEPTMRVTAENGRIAYTVENGKENTKTFVAYGRIVVTPDDQLTITFTSQL
jgi:hypothetical protein